MCNKEKMRTYKVWPSRPVSTRSLSTPRLNLFIVLTRGIPFAFRDGVYLYRQSRVYWVTQLRTNGVHCRESSGIGPVVLNAVPVTGGTSSRNPMDQSMFAPLFPRPLLVGWTTRARIGHTLRYAEAARALKHHILLYYLVLLNIVKVTCLEYWRRLKPYPCTNTNTNTIR